MQQDQNTVAQPPAGASQQETEAHAGQPIVEHGEARTMLRHAIRLHAQGNRQGCALGVLKLIQARWSAADPPRGFYAARRRIYKAMG